MTSPDGRARPDDQRAAITLAMEAVADVVAAGTQVVLTHGNGPQVGNLLVKNEIAAAVVPPVPLDWCGAQTQGTIGVLIMNALEPALARRGLARPKPAVLVSRTLVHADDPHFGEPTKPIGRYLPANEAAKLIALDQIWHDQGERGWRRMVASPEPVECLDAAAAAVLVEAGTPQARELGAVTAAQLRELAGWGEFGTGSMGPKVEAACRFAERGGRSIITHLSKIGDALAGSAGTVVTAG